MSAFPAVEPGVAGHSGYDLARQEFALDPSSSGADAVEFDLGQATEYLLLDGTANGADPGAVAVCLGALDQLELYIVDSMDTGRAGGVSYATAVASAQQVAAFLQLPSAPYVDYLHPV